MLKSNLILTPQALTVLERRYLKRNKQGKIMEKPEQLFYRVADNIAQAELKYSGGEKAYHYYRKKFYRLMTKLEFLPNSPTLMNAGRPLQQLSACFVLPISDSLESIFDTLKYAAIIHKSGGGTGFSFSQLRPKDNIISTTGRPSSGPLSFMQIFNIATEVVKQGGTRRGANIAILRVDHPDIEEFVTSKSKLSNLTNFNISVGITGKFMQALKKDKDFSLIDPHYKKVVKRIKARALFDLIARNAWTSGEPGLIFLDKINQANPTPVLGKIESTNPCGEQPLLPFESCVLGSINLSKMLKLMEGKWSIDYPKLKEVIFEAVRFLDNVIDMSHYPLPQITALSRANRKIGLGIMGFADALIYLKIPYASKQALKTAEEIMSFIQTQARAASEELARTRGAFPNWEKSVFASKGLPPRRNATLTTLAPTGSLSIIAGCSSGIEPIFSLAFNRCILEQECFKEFNPLFYDLAMQEGFLNQELLDEVKQSGSVQKLAGLPQAFKNLFLTAHEIAPLWHVKMQAAFQKYTDNAVSKTVNLPFESSIAEVQQVFLLAYKLGCKGITVYRYGSRGKQVLNLPQAPEAQELCLECEDI
jgi:ribonucleoside-diphosphate reductase alpha chain